MRDIPPTTSGAKRPVQPWSWLLAAATAVFLLFPVVQQWRNRTPRDAGEGPSAAAQPFIVESRTLYQQGMYQKAADAALKALTLNPQSAEAYNNLAIAYLQLRQYDRAIASAKTALLLDPGMEAARNNLGLTLREKAAAEASGGK